MGSLEEEKLFQMVHDFIESESTSENPSYSSQNLSLNNHHAKQYILQEIVASRTAAEEGLLGCVLKHMRHKIEAEKTTSLKKWLVIRLRKDGYHGVCLCQTSWPTTLGCPAGDYEYIEVVIKDKKCSSLRLILDIDFKSQFELARPTSSYKELADTLPAIFVGDAQKLNKIISILCSEAKNSLKERGLHVPPWRTITYMQSKWFSNCQRIIPLNPSREVGLGNKEAMVGEHISSNFDTLTASPSDGKKENKAENFVPRSGLSSQFAAMSTKCF
ncbi:uncharacterized protein LOC113776936 [Coffea eugenioides]|uniref:uncharacterized protein LOC113776936 n=1 Tax=Coffea eugenioides TaxID=49369 RepID=UPI000F60561A|nr:uncharacterized protein LOC113776936 [Coffea eugenioides]